MGRSSHGRTVRATPADLFATAENAIPWTEALRPFLLTAALMIFLIDFALLRVLSQRALTSQTREIELHVTVMLIAKEWTGVLVQGIFRTNMTDSGTPQNSVKMSCV